MNHSARTVLNIHNTAEDESTNKHKREGESHPVNSMVFLSATIALMLVSTAACAEQQNEVAGNTTGRGE